MEYARISAGVWVKYAPESETGTILFRRKLIERKQDLNDRLRELPGPPSNAELLAWAREHYPTRDTSRERDLITSELQSIQTDLDNTVND